MDQNNKIHYNYFTIDYIESIKRNLKIEFNQKGETVYLPDAIEDQNILNLKNDLQSIWENSKSAIALIQNKQESIVQSGLFGLVSDLDKALKVGFLLGDRIVLLDFLFERILLKVEPNKIDRTLLGEIACPLVAILSLAKTGRIVIIPNPLNWYPESKKIINEVSTKAEMTINLMSMLNMLSITKKCNLHPYTLAESEKNYTSILNNQIENTEAIGRDGGQYAYEGILGALLSEKLLNETEFSFALDVPIEKYFQIISSNKEFYSQYLSHITAGGSLNAQNNIDKIKNNLIIDIKQRNQKVATAITAISGLSSSTIALLGAATVISAPLAITGAALGISATLAGILNRNKKEENIIISVFSKLKKFDD
ncbi:MAG: hypothetical protein ACUZ8E_13280 [Candidatus Anammoxibacter sp.]